MAPGAPPGRPSGAGRGSPSSVARGHHESSRRSILHLLNHRAACRPGGGQASTRPGDRGRDGSRSLRRVPGPCRWRVRGRWRCLGCPGRAPLEPEGARTRPAPPVSVSDPGHLFVRISEEHDGPSTCIGYVRGELIMGLTGDCYEGSFKGHTIEVVRNEWIKTLKLLTDGKVVAS